MGTFIDTLKTVITAAALGAGLCLAGTGCAGTQPSESLQTAQVNTHEANAKPRLADRMAANKLDLTINASFPEQPMGKLMESLQLQTKLPMKPAWKALADVGITPETKIALSPGETTAREAIDLLVMTLNNHTDAPIRWSLRHGLVHVSTEADLQQTAEEERNWRK